MRRLLPIVLALALASPAAAAAKRKRAVKPLPLPERIEAILAADPATARAAVGLHVVALASGDVLADRASTHWFVPASNTKLYSTALALSTLGPEHRFTTRLLAAAPLTPEGLLPGDLLLTGGGDPTLSGRAYPYAKDAPWADGAAALEQIADTLAARGLKRIRGAVVGDDTRYLWEPYPAGWSADDGLWEYGAPVSALVLNDNAVRLRLSPAAEAGLPVGVEANPGFEYFTLHNHLVTGPAGSKADLDAAREAASRELHLSGSLPAGAAPAEELLGVDDPALFAAQALYDALLRRGIAVDGGYAARHRRGEHDGGCSGCTLLAERQSPPLAEIIQVVNKVSQNLHAELLLREVSLRHPNAVYGDRKQGLEEMRAFLTSLGMPEDAVALNDGSGLSRLNLISPAATTRLLTAMARGPQAEAWDRSLPVGGADGTLAKRFRGYADAARVHAKTGSLTHVSAMAGYLDHPRRGRLAFSLMLNNANGPAANYRAVLDKLIMTLLEY